LPLDVDTFWQAGVRIAPCSVEIPTDDLRATFRYEDGRLYWRVCSGRVHAGQQAGPTNKSIQIRFRGKSFLIHRLVWELFNGPIPEGLDIDHIDHDRQNNRIENLRAVTHAENQRNLSLPKHNRSGHIGVSWALREGKWRAIIVMNGKTIALGMFDRKEDAIAAREAAHKRYGYHENHGKRAVQ
jgi:hypothetical protein